jgi:hypothetical protein
MQRSGVRMEALVEVVVGWILVAGFVTFLTGAAGWRMAYEQPLEESLRVVAGDRRRPAWIHRWMILAMFVTSAGVAGVPLLMRADEFALVVAVTAAVAYGLGAACWIAALVFRLTVVPWAAERTVADGRVPEPFPALDAWAGTLYVVHMASAYASFALLGLAVLAAEVLAPWVGWTGIILGLGSLAGFAATRAAGPFNPPVLAHLYTFILGITVLAA